MVRMLAPRGLPSWTRRTYDTAPARALISEDKLLIPDVTAALPLVERHHRVALEEAEAQVSAAQAGVRR